VLIFRLIVVIFGTGRRAPSLGEMTFGVTGTAQELAVERFAREHFDEHAAQEAPRYGCA
jgi:glutaredoxin 2